ncbi:RNase3 domain-containing protein [Colletotrichum sojae]|uniref:RNase3 domain-containing protein n=1 Tax=Colletotrichum sojae TaxID=2175907 RepID=A0A8H6JVA6_9PEZI|nr:RNase3 domain-containing protein [Colletotrichum sojae]
MSKRSSSGKLPPGKKRRPENDPVDLLLSRSDELLKCIQELKSSSTDSSSQSEALQNLRGLSKTLLPSFKYLAGEETAQAVGVSETSQKKVRRSLEKTHDECQNESPNETTDGLPIPSFTLLKPWTAPEISTSLPPLPKITNPVLEMAAFTHPGMISHKGALSYDRLEWLGDAYVELISSVLIFQTFGGLPTGKCSQIREVLVRNSNLADYSAKYGLMQKAKMPLEFDPNSKVMVKAKDHEIRKARGDLFEAYVAAVILSDPVEGLPRAAEWLKTLWSSTIKDQIRKAAKEPKLQTVKELGAPSSVSEEVTVPPKVRLTQVIGAPGISIRYEDMPNATKKDKLNKKLDLFTVGVYLDGWGETNKLLATASDLNKKEAGQKAAEMALNNKKMIKVYMEKKKALRAAMGEPED